MPISYEVRVWKTEKYQGARATTYYVRWTVDGRARRTGFATKLLAESFRSDLRSATRRGDAFDTATGRPVSIDSRERDMDWYEFACQYVDMKWRNAAGKYRRSIAEALMSATPAMFTTEARRPDADIIRSALLNWGFNTKRRGDPNCPDRIVDVLSWVEQHTRPVSTLADPQTIRTVLDSLAIRLDGQPAAATTINRKRAVFANAMGYAVEIRLLGVNPIHSVKWSVPKANHVVDKRSVVSPIQARTLLDAVAQQGRSGPRLVAFFALLYFAGLRPEEAVTLRRQNLVLPSEGWGELHLEFATPAVGKDWTDTGRLRDLRQLKHRAKGTVRTVPSTPELTAVLHKHLDRFGTDLDGRLFRGERGGELSSHGYGRVWHRARNAAFTVDAAASPLARRPYDLRHAAVSTWLSGGVAAPQVAEWAGHSVAVLHEVYAKCLDGQQEIAKRRVQDVLGWVQPAQQTATALRNPGG